MQTLTKKAKGKVRKLILTVMVIGILAFSPMIWQAWANPDVIDAGPGAINRASTAATLHTRIDLNNPANDSGTITSVELWYATNATGVRVGTFYNVGGSNYTCRDSVVIGNVTSGSKQTFNGLSITVVAGDYIGFYDTVGTPERDTSGFSGYVYLTGEHIDPSDSGTYTLNDDDALSIYATGETAGAGDAGIMTTNTGYWGATY